MSKYTEHPDAQRCFVELGHPIDELIPRFKSTLLVLAGGIALIAVPIALRIPLPFLGLPVALGFIAVWVGLAGLWRASTATPCCVCPGGIVVFRRRRVESWPWDQVTQVDFTSETTVVGGWSTGSSATSVRLRRQDGRKLDLGEVTPEGGQFIAEATARAMLSRVHAELQTGGAYSFGSVLLRRDGLEYRKERLSWDQIGSIGLEGPLVLKLRDGSRRWIHGVKNLHVLYPLVQLRLETGSFAIEVGEPGSTALAGPRT